MSITLEVGKTYQRRDGRVVEVEGCDGGYWYILDGDRFSHYPDGKYHLHSTCEWDLIEEVTDPERSAGAEPQSGVDGGTSMNNVVGGNCGIRTVSAGINSDVVPVAVPSQRFDVIDWEGDAVCRGFRCEEEAVAYCTRNRGDYDKDQDLFVFKLTPIIRVTE